MRYRKRLNLVEGFDYKFIDPVDEYENSPVVIIRGPFTGLVIMFGKVSVGSNAHVHFQFEIIENPHNVKSDSDKLIFFLGELLSNIIVSNK